jgi:cell division protein FtsZ
MAIFETYDNAPNDFSARIKVIGVGGGGGNAVNSLLDKGLNGIEYYVINTDLQALQQLHVPNKLAIGKDLTHGRGAGGDPSIGMRAAEDARDEISQILHGADMVFIAAGMGGGTGTGAAPVVAELAKQQGILSIGVVSLPFRFEGQARMRMATEGLNRMKGYVDTMIVVSNDRLIEVSGKGARLSAAFEHANHVLYSGVSSINDLISKPGIINVDFADVKAIMSERGGAVLGVGVGKGENRATEAVTKATKSPLLDKLAIDGATGVLICVTGGEDVTMNEVSDAVSMVYEAAAPDAQIIFGAVIDPSIDDEFRVTIIATGFDDRQRNLDSGPAAAPAPRPAAPRPAPAPAPVAVPPPAAVQRPPVPATAPAPLPPSGSDPFASTRGGNPPSAPADSGGGRPARQLPGIADTDDQPGYGKPRFRQDGFEG